MKIRILSGLLLIVLFIGSGFANDLKWLDDFEKAQELASENDKIILVNFTGSDWCPWCFRLRDEVFVQKEFKEYVEKNAILFEADFPRSKSQLPTVKEQNQRLAQIYGIQGFPTVLLLDAKGKVLGQTGYQRGGAEKYVAHLKELLNKSEE